MVYMAETVAMANEVFSTTSNFAPAELLESFATATTVGDAAEMLGLLEVLDPEQRQPMTEFLATIPPAVDAAIMAAGRNALGRGIRVTFSWQPAYDFELRVWDVTKHNRGLVNIHISSPHPVEAEPDT